MIKSKVIISLILSVASINLYAQDATNTLLQKSMSAFMQKNNIPGAAVEMYVNGNLYEQYFGYAEQGKKEPVIQKTVFEIGSISKIMTSILFAQEVDWAKMALNDPVTNY